MIWIIDDTTHCDDFVWIPPQGGPQADRTLTAEGGLWKVEVSPAGGGDGGGGVKGGGYLRTPPP